MRSLVVVLAVLMAAGAASAQTFTGGLRGVVRDANGVIPGVTVTLVNEGTGASRDAVSNDEGAYNFAAVPPGTYTAGLLIESNDLDTPAITLPVSLVVDAPADADVTTNSPGCRRRLPFGSHMAAAGLAVLAGFWVRHSA